MFTFAGAKTSIKNQKGFSLVELMVVVAIIGILAAIAVPSLNKYMAKARQSEAKMNLSGLYTAEKAFYAEYNTYASCFDGIGYNPEGRLRYRVGFTQSLAADATNGFTGTCTAATNSTATACNGTNCTELAEAGALPATALGKDSFTAGAASQLIPANNPDHWTMDNNKTLNNVQDGVN